jgi:hypothetical protein
MQVLQVKQYNAKQKAKYSEATSAWRPEQGGFPQAAFYFFSTSQGQFRRKGFVAFENNKAIWRSTKKEAITAFRA